MLDQSNDVASTLATEIDVEDASGTDTAGTALTIKGGAGTGTGAGGSIIFQTADGAASTGSSVNAHATQVTITDDGNVGIATSSITSLGTGITTLELKGNDASQSDRSGGIRFTRYDGSEGMYIYNADGASNIDTRSTYPLLIRTNGTERMRVDSSGNIRAGTTSGISTEAYTFYTSGAIGMAIRNPLSGAVRYPMLFVNGTSTVGSITTSASSTSFNTTSDYRLKENVIGITDGIERVKQLNPSRFNFTIDPDITVDGFLAHEAQTVVPEAVTGTHNETEAIGDITDADNNPVETGVVEPDTLEDGHTWTETETRPVYQGIDQAKLVPLLTAALQEAIEKIEALETRVAALEA